MRNLIPAMAALALVGCISWGNLPTSPSGRGISATWDATAPVLLVDGLYLHLSGAMGVARVLSDGTVDEVDLGDAYATRLVGSPDGSTAVAFLESYRCAPADPRDARGVRTLSDCPRDAVRTDRSLGLLRAGALQARVALGAGADALAFSSDGSTAIGWLDLTNNDRPAGIIDLTSVTVLNLDTGTGTPLNVGFAADQVRFVESPDGVAERALVLSRNQLAVVDLTGDRPEVEVTFPLTLDASARVRPVGVDLTPDGRFALVTVEGQSDLYVLDLTNRAINLIELIGVPSDMWVDRASDSTVLVFPNQPAVQVIDHDVFASATYPLRQGASHITRAGDDLVLYRTGSGHDVVRFDPAVGVRQSFRLENPAELVSVSPDGEFFVALTRAESGGGDLYDRNPGFELIDLTGRSVRPYLLESQGIGLAWTESDGAPQVLVLQAGARYLWQLDVRTGAAVEIEVTAPPVAIGALPNGPFIVTHRDALGLVSLLAPETGDIVEAFGFAASGLFVDPNITVVED